VRLALDTNIAVYAEGLNGVAMQTIALDLLDALPRSVVVLPAQVLAELFQVLVRKDRTVSQARATIISWCDDFPVVETSRLVIFGAAELAAIHRLSFWDGLVLASAAEGGCRLLLSEDLQNGFTWNAVTVVNPFTSPRHPLLEGALRSSR
jgi:predicted nucleic acid-binding protein